MAQTKKMLRKIAGGLTRGRPATGAEDSLLGTPQQETGEVVSPEPRYEVAPGVWLDYQPNSGVDVTVRLSEAEEGLRLQTATTGESSWFSLSYGIDLEELRQGRYLTQLLDCSSRGPARFRFCLRYLLAEGFQDTFSRDLVVLTGARQEDLVFIRVDEKLAAEAQGAEVLYFFEGRSFDVTLHDVEARLI